MGFSGERKPNHVELKKESALVGSNNKNELLSRRMAQYIIQNAQYFKNAGLMVTEYHR